MPYDVLVRFTVRSDSFEGATRATHNLLLARLDLTRPVFHSKRGPTLDVLEDWEVEPLDAPTDLLVTQVVMDVLDHLRSHVVKRVQEVLGRNGSRRFPRAFRARKRTHRGTTRARKRRGSGQPA
jgi:hypothetical protein